MARLQVKGWESFQHYKHRSPPWIKLHKSLLDNREFCSLQLASKALAPMLWLLASESQDGSITADVTELAFRLRMDEKSIAEALKDLIAKGFFIDASNVLADCLQDADTEKRREEKRANASKFVLPDWVPEDAWNAYLEMRKKAKKAPTERAKELVVKELAKLRDAGENVAAVLDQSTMRVWTDVYAVKNKGAAVTPQAPVRSI